MVQPWQVATGAGVISLLIYLRTMCRTIYVGDSGELAAAVHVMGIPHPPGYPIYVLLGKLFSMSVPVGSPALRLNIFSAVCSAIAVAFLSLTFSFLGFEWWLSGGAALCFAFSVSLWTQSGIPRVYALGAAISSIATWLFAHWLIDSSQWGWLYAASFMVGLGLANHPVAGGHIFAFAAAGVMREPSLLRNPIPWLLAGAAILPGPLLYFTWIPLRARQKPPVNWGNIQSFKDLKNFLSRKDYWRHRWVHSPQDAWTVTWFYIRQVGLEYGFLGSAAILIGIPLIWKLSPGLAAMFTVLVLLNAISMIAHARREDIFHWTRYMITAWYALAFPLIFGWSWMLQSLPAAAQPAVAFLPAIFLFLTRFRKVDLSRHRYADEYSRRILECLPENATLIAQDDNVVFPLMYLRYAENLRPDVKLLEQGVHQLAELRFNPRRDAIYCTHWQGAFNQPASARGPGLRLVAEGLIYRAISTDMPFQPRNLWPTHLLPDIEDLRIPRNYLTRCLLGHLYFMRGEWEAPRDAVTAAAWYDRSARMAWDSAVQNYNLGLTYARHGWRALSEDAFARAAAIDRAYARAAPATPNPAATASDSSRPSPSPGIGSQS